jgi:hypothetical protein
MFLKMNNFSPVRRAAARLHSEDEGVALAAVLGLTLVGIAVCTLIIVSIVSSISATTASRASVQSQAAAQAGIVAAYAGVLTPGSCATNANLYTSTTVPVYSATVYVPSGTNTWQTGCPSSTTTQVRIVSTGRAANKGQGQSSGDVSYVEAVYNLSGAGSAPTDGSIFNTGSNGAGARLADGAYDNVWQVAGPYTPTTASVPITSATPLSGYTTSTPVWKRTTVGNQAPGAWDVPSQFTNANWVYMNDGSMLTTGDWYYRYQFSLPDANTASRFSLSLSFLADNTASEVWVNGVAQSSKTVGIPQNAPVSQGAAQYTGAISYNNSSGTPPYNPYWYYGYRAAQLAATTLSSDWVAGLNTVIVGIKSAPNSEGFLAQMRQSNLGLCNAGYTGTTPPVAVTCSTASLVYNRNVTSSTG